MMVHFRLSVVFIIGVVQVITTSPVTSYASDAARIYPEEQLQLAKKAGVSEKRLFEGKLYGFTFEEILKINQLISGDGPIVNTNVTFEFMTELCEILETDHKTATSHTSVHETQLQKLAMAMSFMLDQDQAPFIRWTLCNYISQPDTLHTEADLFGLDVVPYMEIRYIKIKAQKAAGTKRARVAKEMCCTYKNLENRTFLMKSEFSGLSDDELNGFNVHWNEFEAANTSKSLENICDFLEAKNPDDQCIIAVPMPAPEMAHL